MPIYLKAGGVPPPIYALSELAKAVAEAMNFPPVRKANSFVHGPKTVLVPGPTPHSEMIECEGSGSGALAVAIQFMPGFIHCKFEPFTLRLYDGERIRLYTPDALIFVSRQPVIVAEVKPAAHFRRPATKRLVRVMTEACARAGFQFQTYDVEDLQRQPRFNNLQLLLPYTQDANGSLPSLLRILRNAGQPMPLASLQSLNSSINLGAISVGIRRGAIDSSHRFPLGPNFNLYTR